ncbi:MAG: TRAP transporter small permease, partial [Synergistaceae bacterium]|nr:TRAP transporter small permease [Synergistaceae bacterium]
KLVSAIVEYIEMLLLVAMVLVVCFTVFTRYFLSYTPAWGEESALLCLAWFGFLSMSVGVRDDIHLSVTVLDNLIGRTAARAISVMNYAFLAGFGYFMIVQGMPMVRIGMLNKIAGMGNMTSAWTYAPVPISGGIMIFFSLGKIYDILAKKRLPEPEPEGPKGGLE